MNRRVHRLLFALPLFVLLAGCGDSHTSTLQSVIEPPAQNPTTTTITAPISITSNKPITTKPVVAKQPKKPKSPYPTLNVGDHGNSVVFLQECLAELGYLPVTFTTEATIAPTEKDFLQDMKTPLTGQFALKYPDTPPELASEWQQGTYTEMVRGAVLHFQADHHIGIDGSAGPEVWQALEGAMANHDGNKDGYTYVHVSEKIPETITVWHDDKIVLTTKVNTGVSGYSTELGTHAVYERHQSQTMSGYAMGGYYYDPGVPYVNYFYGGDAVHGFVRSSYGTPQSLGCVEVPIPQAKIAYSFITYGTLVTVDP